MSECYQNTEKHEIEYEKKESLNAIFGKYVKNLVKLEKIESEMTVKILKFSISILDSFNYIRNNKSLAHDNEKIAEILFDWPPLFGQIY
mgnify:CR=1 FL=1